MNCTVFLVSTSDGHIMVIMLSVNTTSAIWPTVKRKKTRRYMWQVDRQKEKA